jgi:hypothetical protein
MVRKEAGMAAIATFAALAAGAGALVGESSAVDGTEMLGAIATSAGTGVVVGGVGLLTTDGAAIDIDIDPGATVEQVLLYLEGANNNAGDFTPTMDVKVDGIDVQASYIGGNTLYGPNLHSVSYRADITGLGVVGPGSNSVFISGLDFTNDNDGAGLLVIVNDGGTPAVIDVRDGNDIAFSELPPPLDSTVKQTFDFPAATEDRFGAVDLFVGSVAGGNSILGTFRPSSIEITTGGVTAIFSDQLNSNDGSLWDTVSQGVTVPAGETSLSVELFSRDDGVVNPGGRPASLAWVTGAIALEVPDPDLCWITTGGFHNAGKQKGSKLYTFGGNVGPPPRGSWQVIDHVTGDNFHSNDVHITSCSQVGNGGPGQPGGKKGFNIDRADFAGTGRLNHVDGYPFTGYVEDAGEPSGKKGNNKDVFSITVTDPVTNAVVFEASASLDGGNVQIHPPTGSQK